VTPCRSALTISIPLHPTKLPGTVIVFSPLQPTFSRRSTLSAFSRLVVYFAAAEYLCRWTIPCRQVGPGTLAEVLVPDADRAVRCGWQSRMFAAARLNAGFFVRRNHIIVDTQRDSVPNASVEVENGTGLSGKVGITRENPAWMLPGTKGVSAEPPPQRRAADLCNQTLLNHVLSDLFDREPGQGKAETNRKFAGEGLNLNDETGGKSGLCARPEVAPPDQAIEPDYVSVSAAIIRHCIYECQYLATTGERPKRHERGWQCTANCSGKYTDPVSEQRRGLITLDVNSTV